MGKQGRDGEKDLSEARRNGRKTTQFPAPSVPCQQDHRVHLGSHPAKNSLLCSDESPCWLHGFVTVHAFTPFNYAAVTPLPMHCNLLCFLLIAACSSCTLSSANTVSTRDWYWNSFPTQRFIFSLPPDFFPSAFLTFNSHCGWLVESTFVFCSALKRNSGMRMCRKKMHPSLW